MRFVKRTRGALWRNWTVYPRRARVRGYNARRRAVAGAAAMRRERRESPYMQFQNHLAVVTGAAKGIGAATARAFAREGAAVALLDVDDSAKKLADSLAPRGLFVHCDVSRADAVERAFEAIA